MVDCKTAYERAVEAFEWESNRISVERAAIRAFAATRNKMLDKELGDAQNAFLLAVERAKAGKED